MNPIIQKILERIFNKSESVVESAIPDEDFIPYVSHFNNETIITKNGELLQVIRVSGFNSSSVLSEIIPLRDSTRNAIFDHIKEAKFALWFNTIRRKKNIAPKGEFKEFVTKYINDIWVQENKWDDQYINELYITVIIEGLDTSITNLKSFSRSFSYKATNDLHRSYLDKSCKKLSEVTQAITKELSDYGARILKIYDWDDVLYSEPMRFFGKLINLSEDRYPVTFNDISSELANSKIALGDREIELIRDNSKSFASIFSLKEYAEVSTEQLDRILQLPVEFIITQSFDFSFNKKDIEKQEYQDYILKVSEDKVFSSMIELSEFVESNKENSTDYGKLQTTIMAIAPGKDELEKNTKSIFEQFSALGFIVVREDIFFEHCFWSQLPGNFEFLRRQKVINTKKIAGFAALHNFPSGSMMKNHWGPAVTVIKTAMNTPYFFNFHDGSIGHTIVVGPTASGKTTCVNFLISQAKKFGSKICYFDFDNSSQSLALALDANYYEIDPEASEKFTCSIDLLSTNNLEAQKELLLEFIANIAFMGEENLQEEEMLEIPNVINKLFEKGARDFLDIVEEFNSSESMGIYRILKKWGNYPISGLITSDNSIDWDSKNIFFNLAGLANKEEILIPLFNYLLNKYKVQLDGSPTIIVINRAFEIFDNEYIGHNLNDLLSEAELKNCVVIMTSPHFEVTSENDFTKLVNDKVATKIFTPDSSPTKLLKDVCGLNDEEMGVLKMMAANMPRRNFLLKKGEDSIIFSLETQSIELLKFLSSDDVTNLAVNEVLEGHMDGDQKPQPSEWLPLAFEILQQMEKERLEEVGLKKKEQDTRRKKEFQDKVKNDYN